MVRRGQFFVIGAVLIAAIILGAVLAGVATITTPETHTPRAVFERSLDVFPAAANHAYEENESARHMEQRLLTVLQSGGAFVRGHGLSTRAHGILLIPGNEAAVILGNARGRPLRDVSVTVDGTTKHPAPIPSGESAILAFSPGEDTYRVTVSFSADRSFTHTVQAGDRLRGVYALRVGGEDQRWQTVRTY